MLKSKVFISPIRKTRLYEIKLAGLESSALSSLDWESNMLLLHHNPEISDNVLLSHPNFQQSSSDSTSDCLLIVGNCTQSFVLFNGKYAPITLQRKPNLSGMSSKGLHYCVSRNRTYASCLIYSQCAAITLPPRKVGGIEPRLWHDVSLACYLYTTVTHWPLSGYESRISNKLKINKFIRHYARYGNCLTWEGIRAWHHETSGDIFRFLVKFL